MWQRADKLAVLLGFAVLLSGSSLGAQEAPESPRLALIALPAPLAEAIATSVAAWNLDIVTVDASGLGAVMPGTADAARAAAETHRAQSVVWISDAESGAAIWIYDSESDRVTARKLPAAPPFDDPTAAAIALTVKTLLRHSIVAPTTERFGAQPKKRVETPPVPTRPRRSTVGASAGIATRARPRLPVEPRLRVGATVRIASPMLLRAEVRAGIGRQIDEPELLGSLNTTGAGVALAVEHQVARFHLRGWLGVGLELTRLALTEPGVMTVTRVNPAAEAGLWIGLQPRANVELGVHIDGSVLLRRQRYQVDGAPALTMPRSEISPGIALILWL